MNSIVIAQNNQLVTTTLAISEGTDNDHASVIKLVRTYKEDLKEFGLVRFEIQPFETAGGTQQREIATLNEQQATLILTYMRNTEIIRTFKKRLVKEFWEMRNGSTADTTKKRYLETAIPATKEFRAMYGIARLMGLDKNAAAISANQATNKLTGTDVLQLLGTTHLVNENQTLYFTPTELGKRMGVNARAFNMLLADAGMQSRRGEHWEVSDEGKEFARILDTGKRHGSGVMVQQIKWSDNVIAVLRATAYDEKTVTMNELSAMLEA